MNNEDDIIQSETAETERLPTRITGTDLRDKGLSVLDVTNYANLPVADKPKTGEIANVDWMKVIELGKALAGMQDGMPPHVRGKWGIACRIAANAHMWRMDPFGVADQTYMVNNRLGYMSQLIHALINRNAPLMHRLSCEYIGEGSERQCVVRGQFISGDEREYTTPKLKDIKVKNSPLWTNDTDQQLWYFGVRSWGRKWVPEVIFGLYTKEELEADSSLGYEDTAPGLHARLKGSAPSTEGHAAGHVAAQLDEIENGGSVHHETGTGKARGRQDRAEPVATADTPAKPGKRTTDRAKAKSADKEADTAANVSRETKVRGTDATKVAYPSTVAEYVAYARRWIKAETSAVALGEKWTSERKLRNQLGLTAEDREPLEALLKKRASQ